MLANTHTHTHSRLLNLRNTFISEYRYHYSNTLNLNNRNVKLKKNCQKLYKTQRRTLNMYFENQKRFLILKNKFEEKKPLLRVHICKNSSFFLSLYIQHMSLHIIL